MSGLRLSIEDAVYQQIMHYVNKSDFEVSGMGLVELREDDDGTTVLYVTKAFLLKQENTSSHTEIDQWALGQLEYECRNEEGELRWWWHSHVEMPVFWSGEDRKTIGELSAPGWFCATVFNKKEEMRSAYSQSDKAAPISVMIDNLDTSIYRELPDKDVAAWDALYSANVTNKSYRTVALPGFEHMLGQYGGSPRKAVTTQDWEKMNGGRFFDRAGFTAPSVDEDEYGLIDIKKELDVVDNILEAAVDAGLGEDEARELADLAEKLMEDNHFTPRTVEERMTQMVLERADKLAKDRGNARG